VARTAERPALARSVDAPDPPICISVDAIPNTTRGLQIWPFWAPRGRDRLLRRVMR